MYDLRMYLQLSRSRKWPLELMQLTKGLTFDYNVIDGDILLGFIESTENHLTIMPTANGGSTTKTIATFHTKGDAVVLEENIKFAYEQKTSLFKDIEAHFLDNDNMYVVLNFCVAFCIATCKS